MRPIFFMWMMIFVTTVSSAQVLFRYGNQAVQKDEFLRAYKKNNTGAGSETDLRDYLDLYVKFKLKVQAAKDQKLDTLASIKNDVAGFRAQMAEQYMQKLPFRKQMIEEAAERSKSRIELSHIYVEYGADTLAAKKVIDNASDQLNSGKDFGLLSREVSTDPYVKAKDGYVGYVSVFSLPYELENVIYGLNPGSYSNPVAGKNGWHIFKVTDRAKNTTLLKVAHILLVIPPDADIVEKSQIQNKADSIYRTIINGLPFADAAKLYSEDKFTFQQGGVLPEFGFTDYDPVFTKAAFDLKKEGEVSRPVETSAGWHIIQYVSATDRKTDLTNAETMELWDQKVSQDSRFKLVTAREKESMKTSSGYKALPYNEQKLWALTDSMLAAEDYVSFYKTNKQQKLFQLTEKNVTVTDWLKFIKDKKTAAGTNSLDGYGELMKEFTETSVSQYYKDHLEKINPDFRYQMQEFFEGSLLFEVMERNIWSVAPSDTTGLKAFYTPRAQQYTWKKSASAIIFNCADTSTASKISENMKVDPLEWKAYAEAQNGLALADSSRFELNQLPLANAVRVEKGMLSEIVINPNDGSSSFAYITAIHPDNEQRNFDESKGLVINDYQTFLEEKWLAAQMKKYPVKIDEAVFKSIRAK
jgi:peptidyl-prolyl cis-trans isomerase SurA